MSSPQTPSTPSPTPSALPQEIAVAASAAGAIAQSILTVEGDNTAAAVIPLTEQLLQVAIQAWTQAHGTAPTVAQFQALLGDVPLIAPTGS